MSKKLKCYRILTVFFVLFCGLLIGTVIFLVFFPHQSRTFFKPILPFPATNLHENTSHHHVIVAADIIKSMDASVDPCDDFYSFSCNGWISKHPLPRVIMILYLGICSISSSSEECCVFQFHEIFVKLISRKNWFSKFYRDMQLGLFWTKEQKIISTF